MKIKITQLRQDIRALLKESRGVIDLSSHSIKEYKIFYLLLCRNLNKNGYLSNVVLGQVELPDEIVDHCWMEIKEDARLILVDIFYSQVFERGIAKKNKIVISDYDKHPMYIRKEIVS